MYDRHNITKILKLIFSACFILVLSACSSSDDTAATTETVTEIPQFIQKLALNTTDPNASLLAWVTIGDGTRTQLTIDLVAGTASGSFTLSRTTYTILIEFEFTDEIDTITLATATQIVDLSAGDASLTFNDADYDISFDDDSDGINNLDEIISGSDPLVPSSTLSIQATLVLDLSTTDGNLLVWITIDGGTRIPMSIDSAAGTSSTSITLSRTIHTVLIEFEFTDGVNTITLATVTSTVDLSSGDASLSFTDADYITDYDDDNDGISNLDEIISGTDPLVADISDCILDTSFIGDCTLG